MVDLRAELATVKAADSGQHDQYVHLSTNALKRPSEWHHRGRGGFADSPFQHELWNAPEEVIAIGSGARAVVHGGAYRDQRLIEQLAALRDEAPSADNHDLDEALTALSDRMLEREMATMRPKARIIRIFALIRPWDVVRIVYEPRLDKVFAQLGMPTPRCGVMQKHRLVLDALWDRLGKPDSLEDQIWYSILAHHLSTLPLPDAVSVDEAPEPVDGPTPVATIRTIHEPGYWLAQCPTGDLVDLPRAAVADAIADDYILPPDMLPTLHAALTALPAKRFVVIGGLSGTGKSTFARLYADAICAVADIEAPTRHRRFVAVRPDWTDPTGLLGHPNLLFEPPRWHRTEALSLILAAVADPTRPYVLILEEMNLARVEHYFAPLLTAMENPDAGLRLHGLGREIEGVPPVVAWPRNLFIIGTVNMDATTQAFSDKVLDRAFIYEMHTIDIEAWRGRQVAAEDSAILDPVAETLGRLYPPLETVGRHFGYRVCDEVLAFCRAAGDAEPARLDAVILSKVLPRLRGDDQGGLGDALSAAHGICDDLGLTRCAARIERMQTALRTTGVARFWS